MEVGKSTGRCALVEQLLSWAIPTQPWQRDNPLLHSRVGYAKGDARCSTRVTSIASEVNQWQLLPPKPSSTDSLNGAWIRSSVFPATESMGLWRAYGETLRRSDSSLCSMKRRPPSWLPAMQSRRV